MGPGDMLVAANRLYGGSITQFGRTISKFGWECTFVDTDDVAAVQAALDEGGERCKALWVESLANPGGSVTDLEPLADAAHAAGVPLIVDNTMATPYLTRPFEHGADLICHSTTKFLSGHGNAMGGCVVDSDGELKSELAKFTQAESVCSFERLNCCASVSPMFTCVE